VIEYASNLNHSRRSSSLLKKSLIAISQTTNVEVDTSLECSIGGKGRDSFQNNAIHTQEKHKNAQMTI
jgi:hypothetical protein